LGVETIEDFLAATNAARLTLDSATVTRFLASIATKRFCILTGLAGSGKTKLAEALAIWLSPSADHFRVVAVGADWTNNEPLLGYADALQVGAYRKPANGALDLMLRAAADPAQPYFLVLDEMNLSHVERYFADVLAAIESANAPLALHGQPGVMASDGDESPGVPGRLPLPRNLFIIGTVNVDETTYTFSPKVLDRANVIEFRATRDQLDAFLDEPVRLNLSALQDADGRGLGAAVGPALVEAATSDHDSDALGDDKPAFKEALLEAFDLLADMGAEFGFRSALEMARFAAIHKALGGDDWHWTAALDAQVLQKLLPRLHGSARKLEPVLNKLHGFCTKHALADSLEKIERMQKRLGADGFASFAEN
jgi:5-methylcytosine-specific restriction protein B